MLITIIYIILNGTDLLANFKAIKENVAALEYDKGQFELIFMVRSSGNGFKKTNAPPLARIFYQDSNERDLLVKAIAEAHGDVIIIGDHKMRLDKNDLKNLAKLTGNAWVVILKKDIPPIPKDLICFRTLLAMNALMNNLPSIYHKNFSRSEILRFAYLHKRFTFRKKLFIIWKYLRGAQ